MWTVVSVNRYFNLSIHVYEECVSLTWLSAILNWPIIFRSPVVISDLNWLILDEKTPQNTMQLHCTGTFKKINFKIFMTFAVRFYIYGN